MIAETPHPTVAAPIVGGRSPTGRSRSHTSRGGSSPITAASLVRPRIHSKDRGANWSRDHLHFKALCNELHGAVVEGQNYVAIAGKQRRVMIGMHAVGLLQGRNPRRIQNLKATVGLESQTK